MSPAGDPKSSAETSAPPDAANRIDDRSPIDDAHGTSDFEAEKLARLLTGHAAPAAPPLPATIGRYVVMRRLGEGGFGVVLLARDPDLDRLVAVKIARPDRLSTPEAVQRFLAEGRAAAKLSHPGLVAVYDVGRLPDGRAYLVSQYIEGCSFSEWLQTRRPADPRQAQVRIVEMLTLVCEAVQHAHEAGLVHRDLKPDNILVDAQDRPFVADFGMAIDEQQQRFKRGTIEGTPGYMSPEQVRGDVHRLDGRADVWALGVILYEALLGKRPFNGARFEELFDDILHREPRPMRQQSATVSRLLDPIVLRCLQKNAADRFPTAADLGLALRKFLQRAAPPGADLTPLLALQQRHDDPDALDESSADKAGAALTEEVQFTVYRPRAIRRRTWYTLLAFAHLAEKPEDAPPEARDPIEEVKRQAKRVLGDAADEYRSSTQDAAQPIPRAGTLTLVPEAPHVVFNPPHRSFAWKEEVHREEFRFQATEDAPTTVRGRVSVYWGCLLIAEAAMTMRVDDGAPLPHDSAEREERTSESARRFRRIYAAYAGEDASIVQQCRSFATALGDQFFDQCHTAREKRELDAARRLIDQADVFQLFWSRNALGSELLKREWEYALSLGRENFVRPVYWETPLPIDFARGLPSESLLAAGFQRLSVGMEALPAPPSPAAFSPPSFSADVMPCAPPLEEPPSADESSHTASRGDVSEHFSPMASAAPPEHSAAWAAPMSTPPRSAPPYRFEPAAQKSSGRSGANFNFFVVTTLAFTVLLAVVGVVGQLGTLASGAFENIGLDLGPSLPTQSDPAANHSPGPSGYFRNVLILAGAAFVVAVGAVLLLRRPRRDE